jgi:hypothetical protein
LLHALAKALQDMPPKRQKQTASAPVTVAPSCVVDAPENAGDVEQIAEKSTEAEHEVPAAIYEQLELFAEKKGLELKFNVMEASRVAGGDPEAPEAKPISQEDYVTVVVTPKLTFQLLKRPEWQTVEDITQSDLRRGFLSRFPPALWLSSEKFSFKPALPLTSKLTQDTKTLFFKIVSDEVADERVMLGILRELEKSYEAIIKRAVTETRSEALQEQFTLQEQAEEVRREQAKHIKELRKQTNGLKEQMQSIQKRLFLVEQEKDQLQREQHQTKEYVQRLERQQVEQSKQFNEQAKQHAMEHQDMNMQIEALRSMVEGMISIGASDASVARASAPAERGHDQPISCSAEEPNSRREVEVQTEDLVQDPASRDVSHRVDQLQHQLGALQGWMLQGSQLLALASSKEASSVESS